MTALMRPQQRADTLGVVAPIRDDHLAADVLEWLVDLQGSVAVSGVSAMWSGRALRSTSAWRLVETPPREAPRALLSIPPFHRTSPDGRERHLYLRSPPR